MKKLFSIGIMAILFSCDDEGVGLCAGYDENDRQQACFGDKTRAQCEAIIANQNDSLRWRFEEGKICGPALPEN
ncbi:hypothetical protein [Ekhidna sp.]|uniref:hypothetical protein n=1 Tax=Ekhidna sp. TaxID=2608089 RepID=UPI003CCBAB17